MIERRKRPRGPIKFWWQHLEWWFRSEGGASPELRERLREAMK